MAAVDIGQISITIDGSLCTLWQYDDAPRLRAVLDGEQAFYDREISGFLSNWRKYVYDIRTAGTYRRPDGTFDTYGLDLWADILGLYLPQFKDTSDPEALETYRRFLLARVFKLNSNGSMADFNKYLLYFFGDRPIMAINNYDMTMTVFAFWQMTEWERALFDNEEFLPVPVGVRVNTVDGVTPEDIFGFKHSELGNFDNTVFANFTSRQ